MILKGAEPFFFSGGRTGILLIHGFTGLPAELLLLGEALSKAGFTVLAVRLAGHATTAKDLARMKSEDWLDSVRDGYAFLSGMCEEIFVCGHSMGGILALLLAAERHVAGIISLAAPIFIAPEQGAEHLPARKYCAGVFVPKARRKLKNVPSVVNETYREMPLVSVYELLDLIERTKKILPEVTVPVLILHSLDDHTASPESAIYIQKFIGSQEKSLSWFDGAGHLLPLTSKRDEVFKQTVNFVKKHQHGQRV